METKIVPISEVFAAAELLKRGEPIVFPTETVYGLGAPVFHEKAISKIFEIKQRPSDNPLIVHASSIEEALSLCIDPPKQMIHKLIERFWPGPLTLVLKRSPKVPAIVSAGQSTVAVRIPSHPVALELIRAVGQPLAAPSANLSGRPSPTRALDAWEDLRGKVSLILDGGDCQIGIESTVISVVGPSFVLLRPGAISHKEVEEILQQEVSLPSFDGPIHSPGMKYRHYAPKAKVQLVFCRQELKGSFILSPEPRPGERLLAAQTLYAAFREADRLGIEQIEVDCSPMLLADAALMNRLLKAAKG